MLRDRCYCCPFHIQLFVKNPPVEKTLEQLRVVFSKYGKVYGLVPVPNMKTPALYLVSCLIYFHYLQLLVIFNDQTRYLILKLISLSSLKYLIQGLHL